MKKAICTLRNVTPVTFGRFHQEPKKDKELPDQYEQRTWKEKAHYNADGVLKIPGAMFANCIRESAKFMSIQILGKGKATYTKHFDAGIIIQNDIETNIKRDKVQGTAVHVPTDGRPGGSKRAIKIFPIVHNWEGEVTVYIGDNIITADVFEDVLRNAGNLIGIGTWRPRTRGMNGRFEVVDIKWSE